MEYCLFWEDQAMKEGIKRATEVEQFAAVSTEAIPKEISLSPVLENSFNNPILLSQPSDFPHRILFLPSINMQSYI